MNGNKQRENNRRKWWRPHRSTLDFGMLVAVILVAVMVPGLPLFGNSFRHGWPATQASAISDLPGLKPERAAADLEEMLETRLIENFIPDLSHPPWLRIDCWRQERPHWRASDVGVVQNRRSRVEKAGTVSDLRSNCQLPPFYLIRCPTHADLISLEDCLWESHHLAESKWLSPDGISMPRGFPAVCFVLMTCQRSRRRDRTQPRNAPRC